MNTVDRGIFDRDPSRLKVVKAMKKAVQSVLDRNLPNKVTSVVEVGCGTGFFYRQLMLPSLKKTMIGIDNHAISLKSFKNMAPQAQVIQGDIENLPLLDSSVDAVLGFSAYPLFYEGGAAFEEVKRVLRPKGRLIVFQDNGIVERNFTRVLGMSEDGIQGVEREHNELIKRTVDSGFKIISGRHSLAGTAVSSLNETLNRLPKADVLQIEENTPSGSVLIGFSNDRGKVVGYTSPSQDVRDNLAIIQFNLGIPGLLSKLRFRPGKEIFQYCRMRFILAEKS